MSSFLSDPFNVGVNESLVEGSQPGIFASNALACAVRMMNIKVITDKETDLLGRASKLGTEISDISKDAAKAVRAIGDIRGRGLMIGVEGAADRSTREPLSPDKCGPSP